ncbi:MAG: Inositol 2-dehydrogenase [Alphaproteobacteria bacterium MarineAlpha5_Bin5]|nr:MAG: Inositol 2-dehydrogenase [Alphaproteobacteria bacterium MarineAlpha5_Bin5]PPR51442.1 MAG: Inositol 2-dehydrogenase [Alphaproteobacteria bacterium MarineAlpha5_Bin4]|tara:strand:- start:3020 stop:4108 length:1089 start_codon:yes stop_codon:yes gene_type:complete
MRETIKYGIIGAGVMGQEHIQNINIIENAEVVAVCDTNESSRSQAKSLVKESAKFYNNLNELISQNIADAYIIATPNFTHINILEQILKTNKHLLIEKPLCTTTDDCKKFELLSKNYSKIIWTGMEYRYMPPVKQLISEVHNNVIGEIKMLSIREHRFPFLHKVDDWNRFAINTGGTLVEKCCHFFDLMRLVIQSEPKKVYASGNQDVNHLKEKYDGKTPDIIDNAFVIVDFENGVRGMLDLCMFAENSEYQEEIVAIGDIGKIETFVPSSASGKDSSEVIIGLRKDNVLKVNDVKVDKKILAAGHHHGSTYFEHLAFINSIQNNREPEVSLRDGLMSVAIGEAAENSIKEKRVVFMEEFKL